MAVVIKDIVVAKKKKVRYGVRESVSAYLLLAPATILALIFVMLPIVYSLGYAFTDYYLLEPDYMQFIGFENFIKIFESIGKQGMIYHAIINTLKFVVGVVPLQIGLALGLALFVNNKRKGTGIFKVCYFAPVVISLTITAQLWLQILSPSETGLLNSILGWFGVPPQDFIRNEEGAIWWIVLLSAWQGCGYQMLIFLSGLSNIRQDLYEAASLDGANKWQQFLHITVPALRSTFLFIVITVFVGASRVMVQPMLMTDEKPHTITISYWMYLEGYRYREVGYSAAMALLMTIVMGAITLVQRTVLREKD
ncbi:MAG: sugar ABC transporter permease [Clostridia bacterium]|nr:sugar ABC transporter permease [Clostridia bacterium]